MRVLIVKLSSIGDIIHALPSLAALRKAMPDAEISWIVEERSAEILRGNPLIDNLIEANTKGMKRGDVGDGLLLYASSKVTELRSYSFDIAIDLQGLIKSGLIARLSGAGRRFGFSRSGLREPAARIFYTDTVEVSGDVHVIKKNLTMTAMAVGFKLPDGPPEFPIATDAADLAEADEIMLDAGGEIAVLNPAGGWVTKLWPAENFGMLADRIWEEHGLMSVVVTGPNEDALAETVRASSQSGKIIFAEPSLKGFYELVRRSALYVGGDTGPTHLAVAAGAPIVGLFGPTEWWRNGSPDPADICVERTDIECRVACHRRTCSNWICMTSDVESVAAAVAERLRRAAGPTALSLAGQPIYR